MADMIKFFKGLEASLPASGVNGALYITTDEGAIYLGTGTGMKRLGDFVQVDAVANLPAKAHEGCLYYCVAENILAKWNGTEWKQINKQPTAEEMKTLLGLGTMAYKSEVKETDLNSDLAAKINAASGAQHSHDNKSVLDGITAEKVAAWDASEKNAKDHADGLNTAMNTRVEALEAIDHEHANKALLDTYTQTEADLADAVAKKHAHTFVESELNKIVDGDVAKWNAVVADHLTSADKTALENSIKEAKKAGTDANTNIETYKVANDARVLAVEEDVAEIVDGTNGILAQAKSYTDGKLATARTEISSEIDADVKVVADDLAGYKTSNDAALAGVKATADAAAVKTEVESALAGKVDKVEGKSLIADTEIARLATLANYDDTTIKADIAKKADAEAMATELGKKVDKVEGKDLIATSEIERLATLKNYDDTALAGRVTTAEGKITALETESAKHALKTDVEAEFAKYTKTEDLPTDLGDFTNTAGYAKTADVNTELNKKADKTQVATDIANAIAPLATTEALNGVKATAEAAADDLDAAVERIDTLDEQMATHTHSWDALTDKPFGTIEDKEVFVAEATFEHGNILREGEFSDKFLWGDMYAPYTINVVYDGELYTDVDPQQIVYEEDGITITYYGNGKLNWSEYPEDNRYPFCICAIPEELALELDFADRGSHTIEVYTGSVSVKKIDAKYIPTNITVDKATTAFKLGNATVGSASQPIYLNRGGATGVTAVGVEFGGTGATNAADARTNLDVYSKGEVDAKFETIANVDLVRADVTNITKEGGLIATAKSEAIAAAKTETETQINTFKTNVVDPIDGRLGDVEEQLANVSNVMDFVGAGANFPETAQKGDVYVITEGDNAGREYVFDGTTWVEFGYATGNENAIAALQQALAQEVTDRTNGDTALGGRIDTLSGIVTDNKAAYDAYVAATDGRLEVIEAKPAMGITADDITAWNAEKGVKAVVDANKATWDKAGTALQAADLADYAKTADVVTNDEFTAFETTNTAAINKKLDKTTYETYIAGKSMSDADLKKYAEDEADAAQAAAEAKAAELDAALKTELETAASNQDAVVLAEAQAYADQAEADAIAAAEGKVNALAGNVYTKAETYTQAEVDALIAAAHTWGEF